MIDRDKQFIFIQPPKTGTTSIVRWLEENTNIDVEYSSRYKKHITAFTWYNTLNDDVYDSTFKFMFVRNPWDRLVSEYHYLKMIAETPSNNILHDPHTALTMAFFDKHKYDFTDFVKFVADTWEEERPPFPVHYLKDNTLVKYAAMNFPTHHGRFIVDYVGKLETIQQDFNLICNRLDITPGKLPHHNKTTRNKDWREYYTDSTMDLATLAYIEDIVRFGYYKEIGLTLTKKQKTQIPTWDYKRDNL
jgi:hypothetical protein